VPVTNGIQVPLNGLISKLKTEGFEISTRTVLDIQKVLTGFNDVTNPDTASLKLVLGPLICRNKEEQEKFYRLFDDYEALLKPQVEQLMEEYSEKKNDDEQKAKEEEEKSTIEEKKRKRKKKIVKWGIVSLSGLLLIALSYYLIVIRCLFCSDPPPEVRTATLTILYNGQAKNFVETDETGVDIVKDSLVEISAVLSDTIPEKKYKIVFVIGDSSYYQRSVNKRIIQAEELKVGASLMEGDSVIFTNSETSEIFCEPKPVLIIEKDSSLYKSAKAVIYNVRNNLDSKHNKYTYKWTLTGKSDTLPPYTSTDTSFKIKPPALAAYSVTVEATGSVNKKCEKKSYTKSIEEKPQLVLQLTGVKKLDPGTEFNFMFIVILLVGSGFILGQLNSRYYGKKLKALRKTYFPVYETEVQLPATTDELTGPYSIDFKPQENKIPAETSINQLAEVMRKRHTGDSYSLNINKTIRSTIKKAGFPVFEFTALSQPTDFLVFVDKEYTDSHLVKLYNHLIATLRKEQVHLTAYSYNQYPLLLTNPALNHFFIPIEKLGGLYPGTILFLFADTSSFFKPYGNNLHDWAIDKFKDWKTKIIFTSVAVKDWGERETILYSAGFTVIPADTNASQVIEDEVNNLIDKQKLKKTIPSTYSTKLINFNEWEEVKNYLREVSKEGKKTSDPESLYLLLKEWLASTAVYPYVNWEVTIAIGKAFEEKYNVPGKLLNYTNLLALSRIQWLKDGQMPDNLRIAMLKDLDYKNEINAREALKVLLDELKDDIKPGSAMYEEYRLQTVTNDFLLKKFNKGDIAPGDKDFIAMDKYMQEGELDWHLDVFYNLKDADSSIRDKSGEKSIPINDFLVQRKEEQRIIDEKNNKEFQVKKRNLNTRFGFMSAAAVLLVLAIQLLGFKQMPFEPPRTTDRIIKFDSLITPADNISILVNDKTYKTELSGDTALIVKDLPTDTTQNALVQLSTNNPTVGRQDLNALMTPGFEEYVINITQPLDKPDLNIYYNDDSAYGVIADKLNAIFKDFNISVSLYDDEVTKTGFYLSYYDKALEGKVNTIVRMFKQEFDSLLTTTYSDLSYYTNSLYLYFPEKPKPGICNETSLPPGLTEIWKGGTSNRLINIDVEKQTIYYSTGDKKTYGRYRIEEVCKSEDEDTYRVITRAGNQYKVFFIKDINRSSGFSLSVCQNPYNTVIEARNVLEANCDRFNNMRLYYENDPGKIFLPAGLNILERQNQQKLNSIQDSMNSYRARKLNPQLSGDLYKNSTFDWEVPDNLPFQNIKTTPLLNETPFDRSYMVYRIKRDEEPGVFTPPNPCDKIYTSMKEALSMDAKLVCRLNLKSQGLRSLPSGLSTLVYLKYLDISDNYLNSKDSIELHTMLRGVQIIFYRQKSTEPPPVAQWKLLKRLNTDSKYYPDSEARTYLKQLLDAMLKNPSAKLQFTFYSDEVKTSIVNFLQSNNWRTIISSGRLETYITASVGGRAPTTRSGSKFIISKRTGYYFDVSGIGIEPLLEVYDPPTKN